MRVQPQQPSGMPIHKYVPFRFAKIGNSEPIDMADRTWPAKVIDQGPALVRRGPARRQPGADRPDVPGPQAEDVRAAGGHGLQGDRGRLPGRLADRLRLRAADHRGGPDPRRRGDPGPDPGPRGADRADLRVRARRQAGHRAPVQLHLHAPAPGGLRPGHRRHHADRGERREAVPEVPRGDARRAPTAPPPRSTSSTRRSPTPAPSWSTRSRSATRSPTSGSPPRTAR